jgi:hypothetical protein
MVLGLPIRINSGVWVLELLKLAFDHEQPCLFSETFEVVHEAVSILKGVYLRGFGLAEEISVHPSKNCSNPHLNYQQRRVDGFQHLPRQGSSLRKSRTCVGNRAYAAVGGESEGGNSHS